MVKNGSNYAIKDYLYLKTDLNNEHLNVLLRYQIYVPLFQNLIVLRVVSK